MKAKDAEVLREWCTENVEVYRYHCKGNWQLS